ncbi:hypothetical protein QE450_000845 [Paenibacillus sp. SORGH_AS306]|uniref:HK97 gp10 family phage protein n=1 Tax=unclassified Paenibacillus TaxID=185978 RepID=UPI00278822B7|nr:MULTISPECIES: HK97 gp10 family phage protein [unclassified Paenibacillus]MDQ1233347.1 hypothetical protein [Paenibacillus sp. SORGH_AS_0306]MDR6110388.1 hypothetical protein [Paenibacillus sp. SORGH_AS_0338]
MTAIDDLSRNIMESVINYADNVSVAVDNKVKVAAEAVRNEAAANAPKKSGNYAKGFIITKRKIGGQQKLVVWNKKYYNLVHLLEKGHAKKNGGRVLGIPHLIPAFERHAAQLLNDIRQVIRNGG